MRLRPLATRVVATAGATAIATCLGLGVTTIAVRAASTTLPTITAHMSANKITLTGTGVKAANGGYQIRAGRYHIHVVSVSGDHQLEIVALHNGYTQQQAQQDFGSNGPPSIAAIQRIDHGVLFYGGAEATSPKHPADCVINLPAASMALTDFNGNAQVPLSVTGKPAAHQGTQGFGATFNAYTYGWVASASRVPHKGWLHFANRSDQPHIFVIQHVKSTTTKAMVSKFIASGANGNPPFGLPGGTNAGVVSPNHSQLLKYNLPAGKYLVLCFWPDYFTGMPHFMMGMWHLVELS